jgi:hypothetical protein
MTHTDFFDRFLFSRVVRTASLCVAVACVSAACSTLTEPEGPPRKETIFAVTSSLNLIKFNAGQPQRVLESRPVVGLPAGESLLGIDYRVARGILYALSTGGRLYTLDTATGLLTPVGPQAAALPAGALYGFDFNPAADRIRIVNDTGYNVRMHPDTGALVDGNPAMEGFQPDTNLTFVPGDVNAGRSPAVVAAGYTYNKKDDKLTTNYAIDRRLGSLLTQGSIEGVTPVVSPNTGLLRTVGSLGLGELIDATFDIADVSGAAFSAVRTIADAKTRLYLIDLSSGRAQPLGRVGDGSSLLGMAVEP